MASSAKKVGVNESYEHSSQNKSSSGSVGLSFTGAGVSATASASRAKGQADGESQSSTNTRLQAGGTLTFNSGGDTTLQGATASAKQVTGTVGGNLNLSSLQDTSQYKENSQSSGFSVSVPITGGAANVSVSHSKTNIDSTYQSVGEQTAIRAGDGGFDIDVQGKTTLTGAQITSTDKAVQGGKNSFKSAGGIDMQDLQNSAQFDADSFSVSATVRGDSRNEDGTPKLDTAGKPIQGKPEGSFGFGSDSGQASSTSTSGISGIAGDTKARTGDKETGLTPLFDAAKTKAEVQSQVAITAEFGKNASKAWGDFATNKENELRSLGKHEEADKWREGGVYRAAGHFVIGGLGGGGAGALASGGISLAADKLNSLQGELKDKLIELGMNPDAAQMFSQGAGMATAGTLGTAAGGTVGGGSAFNTDTNNRQLHPDERRKARELTAKAKAMGLTKPDGSAYTQEDIEDEMRRGSNTAKGETAASNMIINPEADKALGSNPTDPVASTNFDKGAVFNNVGGSVVQVDRDGNPLASKPGNPDLQAYIQANTGGADSPYVWVNTQPDRANPNAGLKTLTPAENGCVTAECAGGVAGVKNPVRDVTDVRNDVADGAALVSRGSGIVGSTATAASTIPGPHQPGAATTAVVATGVGFVADVVEQVTRPSVGKGVHEFFLSNAQKQIDNKLPLVAPVTNEVKTFWTNSGTAKTFEVWVNERWSEAVKQLESKK